MFADELKKLMQFGNFSKRVAFLDNRAAAILALVEAAQMVDKTYGSSYDEPYPGLDDVIETLRQALAALNGEKK